MPEALERYTQNFVLTRDFSQTSVTMALATALNSQDILLSQLYYGQVTDELDTSQPYADITQVRLVPDIYGDVKYVFFDKSGNVIQNMKQATAGDYVSPTPPTGPELRIGGAVQYNRYDLSTGQVTRGNVGTTDGVAVSTDPWYNKRGLLVIKPTEGAALVQKNEELGRASNVIQILSSLLAAQQSAKSSWVNALR